MARSLVSVLLKFNSDSSPSILIPILAIIKAAQRSFFFSHIHESASVSLKGTFDYLLRSFVDLEWSPIWNRSDSGFLFPSSFATAVSLLTARCHTPATTAVAALLVMLTSLMFSSISNKTSCMNLYTFLIKTACKWWQKCAFAFFSRDWHRFDTFQSSWIFMHKQADFFFTPAWMDADSLRLSKLHIKTSLCTATKQI